MQSLRLLMHKIKDGTVSEMWQEWKWIYGYGKRYRKSILFYIFLGIFGTVFSLVSAVASKNLIDIVTGYNASKLVPMAVLMIAMTLFNLLFSSICSRISLKINIKIQNDIQLDIFNQIINVNWMDLSKYPSGDILNRFQNDIGTVAGSAIGWLPNLLTSVFSFLASLVLIIYYDPMMGMIAMLNAPIMLLSSKVLLGRMRSYTTKVKEMNSEMMEFEQETFSSMESIKSFGLMKLFSERLAVKQSRYKEVNLEYNKFSIKTNIILSIIGMVIQYIGFGWGIYRLWTSRITYGEMTLFLSQASKLSSDFSTLVSIFPSTITATISAGRIMELTQLPKEKCIPIDEKMKTLVDQGVGLQLNDVQFSYRENEKVLSTSTLEAKPNEMIALVGPSGGGKTTLIRMILGLLLPEEGEATLVDCAGEKIEITASARKLFAYVPQGNTVFSGTIAENLRMVKEEASEEEIIEALQAACAYEFVSRMPNGIHTQIGERGKGLSEGQAQRIAIARAILCDAPILLFDEATSALDIRTEHQVLANIKKIRKNKTCIVTTHRPSVLSMCHRVYQVRDAKVQPLTEQGIQELVGDSLDSSKRRFAFAAEEV